MADGGSLSLDFGHELVVDLFAGGGGASHGLGRAYREPDVAINHSPVAIDVHQANHPNTQHYTCDVFEVDPLAATKRRPVGVLWASPDCRHHSKAKGGKPRSAKIRGLAWVVVKWAAAVRPRVILLENVEEFADWGPLLADGQPCPKRKGKTFQHWAARLRNLGYKVEHRELVAADFGAPTIRKRLYVIARCDGRPIVWPTPTHPKAQWRSAAECIDWSLPSVSIFDRKRPLAENTCRRIAKGLWRYVLNHAHPFIVPLRGTSEAHGSTHSLSAPLSTITGGGTHHALVTPFLTEHANASTQRVFPLDEPLRTQVAQVKGGHFSLVAPTLIQTGYGERRGQEPRCLDLGAPLGTVVAGGVKHALVSAFMSQASGGPNGHIAIGHDMRSAVSTITSTGSHQQLVCAYMVKYYGVDQDPRMDEPLHTVTTHDRFALVQTAQVPEDTIAPAHRTKARKVAEFLHRYLPDKFPAIAAAVLVGGMVLVDLTLRMLAPRELARAQGFPDTYIIARGASGEPITKTDQVRLIGNSVCPDVAAAIARSNLADLIAHYERAAA